MCSNLNVGAKPLSTDIDDFALNSLDKSSSAAEICAAEDVSVFP